MKITHAKIDGNWYFDVFLNDKDILILQNGHKIDDEVYDRFEGANFSIFLLKEVDYEKNE